MLSKFKCSLVDHNLLTPDEQIDKNGFCGGHLGVFEKKNIML